MGWLIVGNLILQASADPGGLDGVAGYDLLSALLFLPPTLWGTLLVRHWDA